MIEEGTGYVQINRFAETTNQDFQTAIEALKTQGMSQLILDLRNNPGGYLDAAEAIADTFLNEGQAIVTVESNQGERKQPMQQRMGHLKKG